MPEPVPAVSLWQRACRKLRLTFGLWYPWYQADVLAKIRPLTFRPFEPGDIPWCKDLYLRNEPHGLPEFGRENHSAYLGSGEYLIIIAEDRTGPIATFGMQRVDESQTFLCYVMVEPRVRKSGIGTTLLVAAVAMLGADIFSQNIILTALDNALPFYRKFGYVPFHRETVNGSPLNYAVLADITVPLIADCRKMLRSSGSTFPSPREPIPLSPPILPAEPATA